MKMATILLYVLTAIVIGYNLISDYDNNTL